MSTRELVHRLAVEGRSAADQTLGPLVWRAPELGSRDESEPAGFLTPGHADAVAARAPDETDAIVSLASSYLRGSYSFFGYETQLIERPADYDLDPMTGLRWPLAYGPRIDYRSGGYGDPKWAWELNRLQHLVVAVEAWLLSGNKEFARFAVDTFAEWRATHPVGRGIAWANGFEAGLRSISIALCLDALRGSELQSRDERRSMVTSLWEHRKWIRRRPSLFSSANNHRLGELAGLVVMEQLVPELPGPASSLSPLASEADRQILPDGTGAEQAYGYTVFALDLLLLVTAILDAREVDIPSGIVGALGRGEEALTALVADGEPEPRFGDADEGRAALLDARPQRTGADVAHAIAVRLGRPSRRSTDDAASVWMFPDRPHPERAHTVARSVYLEDSGLVVLRDGKRRAIFDAGPLGYLSLAAHGHADALQVTLAEAGHDVVVDPGTGTYFANDDLRSAFRGTRMHATVCVDEIDQAVQAAPFLWMNHYRAVVEHVDLLGNSAVASHDGYRRLRTPVTHRRGVWLQEHMPLVVYDVVLSSGQHEYAQTWPFAPTIEVTQIEDAAVEIRDPQTGAAVLRFASSAPGRIEMTRGRENPPDGLFSPRLGVVEAAWVCRWRVLAGGDVHCVAALSPSETGALPAFDLALLDEGSRLAAAVTYGSERSLLTVEHGRGVAS